MDAFLEEQKQKMMKHGEVDASRIMRFINTVRSVRELAGLSVPEFITALKVMKKILESTLKEQEEENGI